ncbi:hypothetical protein [Salinarimonas chemoclinalis]|uniref:hypothetical protein n=1 Tax=Salinarimonas chemoclinalis TaxID=3241599 RepID=UPI003558F866
MATVTISDELYARLQAMACEKHVAVEGLVESLLVEGVASKERATALLRRFDAIAALTPVGVTQTDNVELIREDRDR